MRKTLQDLAHYLKVIVVPYTHDKYEIDFKYLHISDEVTIREGIINYREFLIALYELLYSSSNVYDRSKKVNHEYENRTTLSVYYPFLHNVSRILINIGYHGLLNKETNTIEFKSTILNSKLSLNQMLECLNFIEKCGITIEGIDLYHKNLCLDNNLTIKIRYPKNPTMLIGLKVMAIAEIEQGTLLNQDIFLRCDYRVVKKNNANVYSIIEDTLKPLSDEIQDFLITLHHRYVAAGLTYNIEVKGFHTYIRYSYKRKDVYGINTSLNNGYHINVKPTKTEEYENIISTFSPTLQKLINKGYGCGRKRAIACCDGGCRGIPIQLDDTILDMRDDIMNWFDVELFHLIKK